MQKLQNIDLSNYNTFKIKSIAKNFTILENKLEILKLISDSIKNRENSINSMQESKGEIFSKFFILGGGSNLLIVKDVVDIPIIKLDLHKIRILNKNFDLKTWKSKTSYISNISLFDVAQFAHIRVQAGVEWDYFVKWSIKQGFYGLENLAKIPGTVGGAVVQNIGAYGAEVADFIYKVKVFDLQNKKFEIFKNNECGFEYRQSVFKKHLERYIVIDTEFILPILGGAYIPNTKHKKVAEFVNKFSYKKFLGNNKMNKHGLSSGNNRVNNQNKIDFKGSIKQTSPQNFADIKQFSVRVLNPEKVYSYIAKLRKTKLPDLEEYPNAGSFFINPIISKKHFLLLQKKYKDIPAYPVVDKVAKQSISSTTKINTIKPSKSSNSSMGLDAVYVKIPAGWLIEKAGFKGYRLPGTDACVSSKHALFLINCGKAKGKDIYKLASKIKKRVNEQFGILLKEEVYVLK